MANHKRKKPKLHLFVSCCRSEAERCTGNGPFRSTMHDKRQPQFWDEKGRMHYMDDFSYDMDGHILDVLDEMEWDVESEQAIRDSMEWAWDTAIPGPDDDELDFVTEFTDEGLDDG
jgi:hypothetical protein